MLQFGVNPVEAFPRSHNLCQSISAVTLAPLQPLRPNTGRSEYFVGVEISPTIIRAGVFSESMRLIGKTKLSTKPERGPEKVIERVARCIAYAADECDLALGQVSRVGVGVPGDVDAASGTVRWASDLSWTQVPLRGELEKLLPFHVCVDNAHRLGALGIFAQEVTSRSANVAVLLLGSQITGAVIQNGILQSSAGADGSQNNSPAPDRYVLADAVDPTFRFFSSRDLRKGLRKGNPSIRQFVYAMARRAGQVAVDLSSRWKPEIIAIGGGVVDEMKEPLLEIFDDAFSRASMPRPELLHSGLGDLAGIVGAVVSAGEAPPSLIQASSATGHLR